MNIDSLVEKLMKKADHLISDFECDEDDFLHSHYIKAIDCDSENARNYIDLAIRKGLIDEDGFVKMKADAIKELASNAVLFCYKEFDRTGKRLVFGIQTIDAMSEFKKKRKLIR